MVSRDQCPPSCLLHGRLPFTYSHLLPAARFDYVSTARNMARFTALLVVVGLLAVSSFAAAKEPAGFKFAAKKKAPPPRRKSPPPHIPSKTCEDPYRAFKLLSKDGE